MARLYHNQSDTNLAIEFHQKAINRSIHFYGNQSDELALSYRYYGSFLIDIGNEEGFSYLSKSEYITRSRGQGFNRNLAALLLERGSHYFSKAEIEKASNDFIEGYQIFRNSMDQIRNTDVNLRIDPLHILFTGKIATNRLTQYRNSGDISTLLRSYALFDSTVNLIEHAGIQMTDHMDVMTFRGQLHSIFSYAIEATYLLYQKTGKTEYLQKVFHYAENSKAAIARYVLHENDAKAFGNIPDSLIIREKEINITISQLQNQLLEERSKIHADEARVSRLTTSLFDASKEKDALIRYFENNFPRYFNLKYNHSVISAREVMNRLNPNECLISYSMTDSLIISLCISNDKIVPSAVKSKHAQSLTRQYRKHFNLYELVLYNDERIDEFTSLSHELFNSLIEPFSEQIEGHDIIIVPDGELSLLPFESLITQKPGNSALTTQDYLVSHHTVRYAPSASLLFNHLTTPAANKGKPSVLAFAPEYNNNNTEKMKPIRADYSHLPGAYREVRSISNYFKVKHFTSEDASESNFKALAEGFDIIHFAMHTHVDDQNPYSTHLVFNDEGDEENDGYLNIYEIYNLTLNGRLVVLSSCNSGQGVLQKGEGLLSLSRAFQFAGISSIIDTLWSIEDNSSADIMKGFYRNLASGLPKDESLRMAKVKYIENSEGIYGHPYFWAGYISIGDNNPLSDLRQRLTLQMIMLSLSVLALLVLFTVLVRKRIR
jgi:CHAT domain-containing protein